MNKELIEKMERELAVLQTEECTAWARYNRTANLEDWLKYHYAVGARVGYRIALDCVRFNPQVEEF